MKPCLVPLAKNNRKLPQYKSLFFIENAVKIFHLQENEK